LHSCTFAWSCSLDISWTIIVICLFFASPFFSNRRKNYILDNKQSNESFALTMNPLTIETLPPEIPETLESALQLPSNEVMRKGSNKNFFTKWFKNRDAEGKTERLSLDKTVKATRRTGRLDALKEERNEVESPVLKPPVQVRIPFR
jgi:hypothetical protein